MHSRIHRNRSVLLRILTILLVAGLMVLSVASASAVSLISTSEMSATEDEDQSDPLSLVIENEDPGSWSRIVFLEDNLITPSYHIDLATNDVDPDVVVFDLDLPWGEAPDSPGY